MSQHKASKTYVGTSRGRFGGIKKAARDAERQIRADFGDKGPAQPIKYKADVYVRIGNPIHEYVVELTQQP